MEQIEMQTGSFPCPEGDLDDLIFADEEYSVSQR